MAVTIRHKFVTEKVDDADTSLVGASAWNDNHSIAMPAGLLGNPGPDVASADVVAVGAGLSFSDGMLTATGVPGVPGPTGPQGPAGVQGLVGPAGPIGLQGPTGLQGVAGPQGVQGVPGAVGPQGPGGGATGPAGPMGPQGPAGVQGLVGPAGPIGLQGPTGLQGVAGPQGSAGLQGVPGAVGPQGPAGSSGGIIDAVMVFGFVGDDSTDNNTAMNNLVSYANTAGHGTVYFFRPGKYRFSGEYIFNGNNITLKGSGSSERGTGTWFRHTGTSGWLIHLSGTDRCAIEDILFYPVNYKGSGGEIIIDSQTNQCAIRSCQFIYTCNAVTCNSINYVWIEHCYVYFIHGNSAFYVNGQAASVSNGLFITDCTTNNPYPTNWTSPGVAVKPGQRAANTAYTLGNIAYELTNGSIWQCTKAGTTGSGAFPTRPAYSLSNDPWTKTVTDGTVIWSFVFTDSLCWLWMDSYTNSITLRHCAFLSGWSGIRMVDSAANTGASIAWIMAFDLEIDFPFSNGVHLYQGSGFYCTGSYICTSFTGNGVYADGNFEGEIVVSGCRIVANALEGVNIGAGPTQVSIHNNVIGANGQRTANNYAGVVVQNNATNFSINGNMIGLFAKTQGSGQQSFPVSIGTGCTNFSVQGNVAVGNASNTYNTGTTAGTGKIITNNV